MSVVETVIGFISPKSAYNRARYNRALDVIKTHQRKYDAAARSRRTSGMLGPNTSANNETATALTTLRNRARELERNNPYQKRGIRAIKTNTIGTGIRPTPTSKEEKLLNKIKDLWWRWAETTECDWEGRETFFGIQSLIMGTIVRDGECLVRKRRTADKNAIIPVKLQVCEVDFLDTSKEIYQMNNGGWIIQGVEFNKEGQRVGYWMFDRHPADSGQITSKLIPVTDVIHIYLQDRPGQVRGVPWSDSVMVKMNDFEDFEDAQLMQQKIAACFSAFITKEGVGDTPDTSESDQLERIEPGAIEHLQPGEKVEFASPPSTQGQDAFSKKVLQAISAGLGVSYESLTGDYSNVNFSSGRMGWLEMYRNIREWQTRMMIPQFCDPAWQWFIMGAQIKGIIPFSTEIIAEWTPPRREMIDPVKETTALASAVKNGLTSWQDVIRQQGLDPDVVIAQIAEDYARFDKHGVIVESDARQTIRKKEAA